MDREPELIQELRNLDTQIRGLLGAVDRLLNYAVSLNLPAAQRFDCPHCGLQLKTRMGLDEHVYTSHDGPEPPHWAEIEAAAAADA